MHFTDAIRSTTTKRLSKYARCVITILFKHNHLHNKLVIIHLTPALIFLLICSKSDLRQI